jgi:hypothetical protein
VLLGEMASKKRGRPPLFGEAMTPTEYQRRWRAKVNATWQTECAEHGPLWGLIGSKPISAADLAAANPSGIDVRPESATEDESEGAKREIDLGAAGNMIKPRS